jgi:hypothetical protein
VSSLEPLGRVLILLGVALAITGVVLVLGPRIPLLGRLPGDIRVERDGVTIYLPLATLLLVSVGLSILLSLFGRGR